MHKDDNFGRSGGPKGARRRWPGVRAGCGRAGRPVDTL